MLPVYFNKLTRTFVLSGRETWATASPRICNVRIASDANNVRDLLNFCDVVVVGIYSAATGTS